MPKIKIAFKFDGTMTADAEGFKGAKCIAETNKLIDSIVKRKTSEKYKNEFYVNEANTTVSV